MNLKSVFSFKLLVTRLRKIVWQFYASGREAAPKANQGFALLITLVVVSVVLAIGLSLLFVTTKQYLLAVTAIESEKSFQSAQIGLECMRYHRAQPTTKSALLKEGGAQPPSLACAGVNPNNPPGVQATTLFNSSGQLLYNYKYQYTLNGAKCAEPSLYIADLREATTDLTYNLTGEGLGTIECTAGTICTVVFARGYNRPCDQLDSIFTIQREITIEY